MSVGKRINKRRKQLGLSVDDVAKRLNKNRATIYRYESSEIENMPLDIIKPLSKALNVHPSYLMGWDEEKETISSQYSFFPGDVSAGLPLNIEGVTETEKISIPDEIMGKHAGNKNIFFVRINGESMNKTLPHNSMIAVKPVQMDEIKDGDIVVYSNNHNYGVKYFYRQEDEVWFRPHSTDFRFRDDVYTPDNIGELSIHGKVVIYIVERD